MRDFLVMLVFAAPALFSSCVARAPSEASGIRQFDIPGDFVTTGERMGGTDREWLYSFKDNSLHRLVDEVLKNNFDLERAAARVQQAQADAKIAGARLFPLTEAAFDAARQKQAFIGFPTAGGPGGGGGGSAFNNFGVSLNVNWELDLWGRIRAAQSAAIGEMQASKAELIGLQTSLGAQTAKAWFSLIEAEQQLALAESSLKSFRDSEQTVRDQFELAAQSASQLRLIMSDVASAEALVAERLQQKKSAARQVEILLGRYPKGELDAGPTLPKMPKLAPPGIPSEVLHRRTDIIAAERRIAAADKRILEAKLALLPRITLTGSAGTATDSLSDVLNADSNVWNIGANAAQTVFAGGEIRGNVERRKAVAREALANYQTVALQAFTEVEDALTADTMLRRREDALVRAETLLVDAFEQANREYKDGVGDVLTILLAQRQMLDTQSLVLTIKRLRLDNRVDLHVALGGKFRSPPAPRVSKRTKEKKSRRR